MYPHDQKKPSSSSHCVARKALTGSSVARSAASQPPWKWKEKVVSEAGSDNRSTTGSSWQKIDPSKKTASEAGSGAGSTAGSSWRQIDPPSGNGSEINWQTTRQGVAEKRPRPLSDGEKADAGVSREAGSGTYKTPEAQGCRVSRQKMNALQVAGALSDAEARTGRSASRERAKRSRAKQGSGSSSDDSVVQEVNAFGRFTRLPPFYIRSPSPGRGTPSPCRGTHRGAKGSGKGKAVPKGKGKGGQFDRHPGGPPFYARRNTILDPSTLPGRDPDRDRPGAGPGGGTGTTGSSTSVPEETFNAMFSESTGGSSSGGALRAMFQSLCILRDASRKELGRLGPILPGLCLDNAKCLDLGRSRTTRDLRDPVRFPLNLLVASLREQPTGTVVEDRDRGPPMMASLREQSSVGT